MEEIIGANTWSIYLEPAWEFIQQYIRMSLVHLAPKLFVSICLYVFIFVCIYVLYVCVFVYTHHNVDHGEESKARMATGKREMHVLQLLRTNVLSRADVVLNVATLIDVIAASGAIGEHRLTELN